MKKLFILIALSLSFEQTRVISGSEYEACRRRFKR